MVHEDGAARVHDDAMRVRIPPVRAPSPPVTGRGPLANSLPALRSAVRADARGLSGTPRVRIPTRPRHSAFLERVAASRLSLSMDTLAENARVRDASTHLLEKPSVMGGEW